MSERLIIHQGDHVTPAFVRPGVLAEGEVIDSNWQCKTAVIDAVGGVIVETRGVTEKSGDNLHFYVALTPGETALLTVAKSPTEYAWVIEVSNAVIVPPYKREHHTPLWVKKQGIT